MELDPKKFAELLVKIEAEGDQFLLARNQMVENDKERNANREALTALRKIARTTKTSVPSPFDSMMKDVHESSTKPLVQEVCSTCGSHDSSEPTWMVLPGADLFAAVPFHAVHTMLEKDEVRMEFESKKLQSLVKEKALFMSELGALADSIPPGVIRSLVALEDKPLVKISTSSLIHSNPQQSPMNSHLFRVICVLHSIIALTSGTLMMFYTEKASIFGHGSDIANKLKGSTPHDELLIQISQSFSGLLLFAIGLVLFMVSFVKDRDFHSFFAGGSVVLYLLMALWRVMFECRIEDLAFECPKQALGDIALAVSWVFFLVYTWREKYD
ncbi:unnamed protein product [Thlaspi arvense]|uniref:DUF7865 domain-containing protein n=1 Tax=Thlaspi arvense TaxID=13288 RepID=A0AAU9S0D0_THLAR|nr:unnamed protein product [Thlaspi arvense]